MSPDLRDHLRAAATCFGLLLAAMSGLGFLLAWTGFSWLFVLVLPGGLAVLAWLALGGSVLGWRGLMLARRPGPVAGRVLAALAVPVLLAATIAGLMPALAAGGVAGTWTRLAVRLPRYEAIAALAEREPERQVRGRRLAADGIDYEIDPGSPLRIAFEPDGILDNWSAIVRDPSGAVALADGFDPVTGRFAAPARVTGLFGGDLVACRHLWGHYYNCSFT